MFCAVPESWNSVAVEGYEFLLLESITYFFRALSPGQVMVKTDGCGWTQLDGSHGVCIVERLLGCDILSLSLI